MIKLLQNIEKADWVVDSREEHSRFLDEVLGGKQIREVKSSRHRTVIRVSDYYVKVFHHANLPGKLKLILHNMPRREWENARKLFALTGLTARPISFGKSADCTFFVSKSLQPCVSLADFFSGAGENPKVNRKRLMISFLHFLEKLRDAGFFQPDFHLNNILLREMAERDPMFFIVDLHRAFFATAPLSFRKWAEQLTYILPCFDFLPYEDLKRFWIIFTKKHPPIAPYYPYILDRSYRRMRAHWVKKKRKIDFSIRKIKSRSFQGYVAREKLPEEICKHLEREPEHLFRFEVHKYKDSRSAKISLIECENEKYIFKKYNRRGVIHTLKYFFRTSRALSHWKKSIFFRLRGLPTPEILASLEERKHGLLRRSFILSKMEGEGANSFATHQEYLKRNFPESLKHLALLVWEMHQRGIYHGDAKLSNFIPAPEVRKYRYYVIDLDGTKFKKSVNRYERMKDLADLASSIEFLGIVDKPSKIIFKYYRRLCERASREKGVNERIFNHFVTKRLMHKKKRQGG